MPICHYFQQGNCRFGDRCRFDHPRNQPGFSNQGNYRGGGGGSSQSQYRWSSSSYGSQADYRSQGSGDYFSGRGGGGDGNWGNRGNQGQGGYRGGGGGGGSWGGGGGGGGGSWGGGGSSHNGGGGGVKQVNFKDSFGSFQKNKFGVLADQASKDNRGSQHHGSSQDVSAQEIMDGIHYDMEEWENGKMWPFSCYGPNKSKSCLSGLEDLSPEELRILAYTAEKTKQFDQYRTAYNTALDAVKNKRDQLKRPSQAMRNQLVDLYKGASDRNPFAAATISNLFGNSIPSLTDIFAAIFANMKVTMGAGSGTGSVMGNQSALVSGSSMQSAPAGSSGNAAGNAAPSGSSVFSRPQGTFQGVFSSTGGKMSGTVSATFGSAPSSGTSSSSILGPAPSGGTSSSSILGPAPSGRTSSSSILGPVPQGSGGSSAGLFGKGSAVAAATPAPAKAESRTYTPLAALTPEEKEQFEAPSFTLGKVPTRPPPIELVR